MRCASDIIDAVRIRLMADYATWPLWGPRGLLDEDDLPLSSSTKQRIKAWLNAYDLPPRPDWPLWQPPETGMSDDAEEAAWVEEGEQLRDIIAAELGPDFDVVLET
jgi:hypothetical protein